jgi:hypothetical protein
VLEGRGGQEDRFFQVPFRGLDQILEGVKYECHPGDALLYDYISAQGAIGVEEETELQISRADEVASWLEGKRGWSRSALSLHILSCRRCREHVESLRAREKLERSKVSPWQALVELALLIKGSSLLRRSTAVALILLAAAAIIVLLYPSVPPSPTPIYLEDKIGDLKGVG